MTDKPPRGYERTENGKTKETITFWAEVWRPMEGNGHGEARVSPKFGTEPECVSWVRGRRDQFETVAMWKRTSRDSGDYDDAPLHADDDVLPNPERLHEIVKRLKDMLDQKKRELDGKTAHRPRARVERPAKTMDPLETRALTYHEVYDEHGQPRFEFSTDGWPAP